jgi:phosphoadenosine phosphosulfate reductase
VVPLRRAVAGFEAWISAIRRDQTEHRAKAALVQWDAKFSLVKVNPLLSWTKKEVWGFLTKHAVPYNPLHDHGYPSIGCWPCTRPVGDGDDERAGRWAGKVKKECGLHVIEHQGGSGI